MKKILSILIITALSLITFNASAQREAAAVRTSNRDVKKNSLHSYTVDAKGINSTLVWESTPTKEFLDVNGVVIDFALAVNKRLKTVYLRWDEEKDFTSVITVTEVSVNGCYDDKINTNRINVKVIDNDFNATLAWGQGTTPECAIDGEQSYLFKLAVTGFKAGTPCKYKYQVGTSTTDQVGDVNWEAISASADFDPADLNITVTKTVEAGDGQFYVWVKVTELFDGYNTPVNNVDALVAKAIINKIPTAATITID